MRERGVIKKKEREKRNEGREKNVGYLLDSASFK